MAVPSCSLSLVNAVVNASLDTAEALVTASWFRIFVGISPTVSYLSLAAAEAVGVVAARTHTAPAHGLHRNEDMSTRTFCCHH